MLLFERPLQNWSRKFLSSFDSIHSYLLNSSFAFLGSTRSAERTFILGHKTPQENQQKRSFSDPQVVFRSICDNVIGSNTFHDGPFGKRKLTYLDYTASGKSLEFIENYIRQQVMPFYANTHTSSSITGLQSTLFRHEAREIIKNACNGSSKDVVLLTGTGSTGAIAKMVQLLQLNRKASDPLARYACKFPGCNRTASDLGSLRLHQRTHMDGDQEATMHATEIGNGNYEQNGDTKPIDEEIPVVFVGPYEHHSNLLPWREAGAEVITISEDRDNGGVDLSDLEAKLLKYASRRNKIGSFSAASNISGILTDTLAVTALLHRHDALAFWDYATAAPYVKIDMNPKVVGVEQGLVHKDAVFISTHKFVGGPGTPGVLIVKKNLLKNTTATVPGGGTVFFVTENDHRYLENLEEKEEGGTPDVLGAIRAGLVFHVKNIVGVEAIEARELELAQRALEQLSAYPNVHILGHPRATRLPIISFMISHGKKWLHWNFVSALLNDLFGIQCRGGCVCAGPYGLRLFHLNSDLAKQIEEVMLQKNELMRPGFIRINLPYFIKEETFEFVMNAIGFVAEHGYKFLSQYVSYIESGEWKHRTVGLKFPTRLWIHDLQFDENGVARWPQIHPQLEEDPPYQTYLDEAYRILEETEKQFRQTADHALILDADPIARNLRWFALPSDRDIERDESESSEFRSDSQIYTNGGIDLIAPSISGKVELVLDEQCTVLPNGKVSCKWNPDDQDDNRVIFPENVDKLNEYEERENKSEEKNEQEERNEETDIFSSVFNEFDESPMEPISTPQFSSKELNPQVSRRLLKFVGKAIHDFDMIRDGDRLLVGLSGGKDSLTLLHVLRALQRRAPIRFDLAAITVDPQADGYNPAPLIPYLSALGIPYYFESEPVLERAKEHMTKQSICSWCSRMKRGIMYSTARREGCNVLVLGQHLDDLAESFVMSSFLNGKLRTMKANYVINAGDIRVIRPLMYVRERWTREFAEESNLPVISENCPACFEEPKERYRTKLLLSSQEHLFPNLFQCLLSTMLPLIADPGQGGKPSSFAVECLKKMAVSPDFLRYASQDTNENLDED